MENNILAKAQEASKLYNNANATVQALELCNTTENLEEVLGELGFHLYTYKADTIYRDGEPQKLAGVTKIFNEWGKTSESLGITTTISLEMRAVRATDVNQEFASVTLPLSMHAVRLLARLV